MHNLWAALETQVINNACLIFIMQAMNCKYMACIINVRYSVYIDCIYLHSIDTSHNVCLHYK